MKTANKRRQTHKRPKHKQTKSYLKHYYPFLPVLISIGFFFLAVMSPSPFIKQKKVLSTNTKPIIQKLLEKTNYSRNINNSQSLALNDKLSNAAQAKANDMVAKNYWSHQTPDNNQPWVFIDQEKYDYQKAGENLAYGFNNSTEVIEGWLNSPTHKQNMLDNDYSEVGFGIAHSKNFINNGATNIIVAMYAKPAKYNSSNGVFGSIRPTVLGENKNITLIESLTQSSWIGYIIGVFVGVCLTYLLFTHSLQLKRSLKSNQKFFIKRPIIDSIIIILAGIGVMLLKSVIVIL